MSVIPLSVRNPEVAKATPKSRVIPGTANVSFGYRLRQQSKTRRNVSSAKQSRHPPKAGADTRAGIEVGDGADADPRDGVEVGDRAGADPRAGVEVGNGAGADAGAGADIGKQIRATSKQRVESRSVSILPVDEEATSREINAREERENSIFMRTYEFVERTNKNIRRKNIRHLVDEGMAMYESTIEARRQKLRAMIQSEEDTLLREIIDQAQRGADGRMDEMRKRAEDLRKRREDQRLTIVEQKRMQQYLADCPEVRDKFARKATLETKYSNLVQIAENEAKRQAEAEVDVLWYELMLREVEAKKSREIEEEKRRAVAGKDVVATLEKQIAGKLALNEEEKRIKEEEREYLVRLWESVKQEELSNLEWERTKRAKLKKDLEEQLSMAKKRLADQALEESTIERMFHSLGEAELERERSGMKEASSQLRAEISAYMKYLEDLRIEEARRNAEVEAIIQMSAKEAQERKDLARQKSREERARLLREVLEVREQQLKAKREERENEKKRAEVEAEFLRKKCEFEAAEESEAEARRRENALRYGQELKAQQKYVETLRQRENAENEKMRKLSLEREQEYEKLTERLVNAPEIITPHAFKILLKECSARRGAEQKGLCYCPTPLPPTSNP